MSQDPDTDPALDDTPARLLALEMVTVAALNRLLGEASDVRAALTDLGTPGTLPDGADVAERKFMDHVQKNVARLASGIAAKL